METRYEKGYYAGFQKCVHKINTLHVTLLYVLCATSDFKHFFKKHT